MALLPDLVGRIRLDLSELDRGRSEAQSRGAAIGSALGTAVGSLAGGLLAETGQKIMSFVSGSVDAFAKLQDATQAAGVVFGSSFDQVDKFTDGTAKAFGISKAAALDASLTFGTFGKSAGLAGGDLAGFSNKMVGLAGDMASFRGTSPEEAINAIGAAFRGEYDPIEQYGVLINANTVKQEAERMGLIKHGQELDNHARILATQSLIYKQTADAQGDFQRSGDSVANTQKRIAAETENAQAALGEKLAPAYLAVLNALNPVIGALTQFIGAVTSVVSFLWQWRDAIAGIGAVLLILNARMILVNAQMAIWLTWQAIQAIIEGLTAAWWALDAALTANPIGIVIAAVAALVAGIIVAYNHSETFRNYVNGLWQELQQLWAWLSTNVPQFVSWFVDGFGKANAATDAFWQRVGQLPGQIGGALTQANQATDTFWQNVANGFQQAENATDGFWQRIGQLPGQIGSALGPLAQNVWNWVVGGFERARDGVNSANQALFGFIGQIPERINSLLGGIPGKIWDLLVGGWNRMVDGVRQANAALISFIQSIPQSITSALTALPGQLYTIGQQIIQGLLNGLQSLGPQIVSYLTNLIPAPVRQALNIASPSGVMRTIGTQIMQGLDQGISALIPQLQAKMAQIGQMLQAQGQQAAANVANTLSTLKLPSISNVQAQISASGASGSATIGGQQVSGSISKQGISGSVGGKSFNIDARSFGTQLNPQDVIDKIIWQAKVGGLVPA